MKKLCFKYHQVRSTGTLSKSPLSSFLELDPLGISCLKLVILMGKEYHGEADSFDREAEVLTVDYSEVW